MSWQLQDAKNKLSQVLQEAQHSGPQVITVRGKAAAVVLSTEDYRCLVQRQGNLVEFFQKSPWASVEIDISRSKDIGRDVAL